MITFDSIWFIDGTLTDATIAGQSGPGSNGNEGVLRIPQSSWTRASPSEGLVSYSGNWLKVRDLYSSVEMQLVYSTHKLTRVTTKKKNDWKYRNLSLFPFRDPLISRIKSQTNKQKKNKAKQNQFNKQTKTMDPPPTQGSTKTPK